ncbi:hypothetical protein P3T35_001582 [Kitasatospora sp. GP30]|uniref:hypothetical protein n=1 Tax=Kitasatospora sp. GP30 TaxID=3035084 RepID=UPI000C70D596|nr:hypothetical protein [Kitasatospora sp. GP30]MDH6139582.1 hypothetical protein [Kitasatospora sp. GP30]
MKSAASSERVEAIPFLKRSWYRRDAGYWLRRAWLALFQLALIAFLAGLGSYLFIQFSAGWGRWRPAATLLLTGAAVVAVGFGVRDFRRRAASPPTPEEVRRKRGRGPGLARAGQLPVVLLGFVILPVMAGYLLGAVLPDILTARTIRERGAWMDHERKQAAPARRR